MKECGLRVICLVQVLFETNTDHVWTQQDSVCY